MDELEEKVSGVKSSDAHSPSEDEITALVTHYTCTRNCSGQKGNAAGCCTIASRDFIIGPITDPKDFLKRLSARDGRNYSHAEVFIDYKEGRKLFPDKTAWQTKEFYPALRVQTDIVEPVATLHLTAGDDILRVSESIPLNLDGGAGFDRLQILGKNEDFAGVIDLAQMDAQGPSHIELIDLHNGMSSKLQIDAEAVARLVGSDVLYIVGDHDGDSIDQVFFQDSAIWSRTGVAASPEPGGTDCIRYEADVTINGVAAHLTVAIAADLVQPIG